MVEVEEYKVVRFELKNFFLTSLEIYLQSFDF